MKKIFLAIFMASSVLCWADDVRVSSPDGNLVVTVNIKNGVPSYSATLFNKTVIEHSALGLKTSVGNFTQGLQLLNHETTAIHEKYQMRGTKASSNDYQANRLTVNLQDRDGLDFDIIFQVSNNDIAFKYAIPRQKYSGKEFKRALVYHEASAFNFPDGTKTFLSPQIGPETGWEQTKPSYEEVYGADQPMDAKSRYDHGYVFPALFHLPNGWALVSETGVGGNYCGSHLGDYVKGRGYTIAYPDKGENNGFGSEYPAIPLPGETPWRTITVAGGLQSIMETTISYDLVKPRYEASTDYKPGRYTWSWLIGQDNSINYEDQVRFIDLASAMGFEYCLVDNWWDQRIGRDQMAELSKYAQSKGVHLLAWYNSNGYWNDAPQTPRDCMNTAIAREREMSWLQSIGVKGIKVDFFGGDKQETMKLYEDILSDANRHGLQVVFHGCTVPRGWERMYPNFVASEAVLASENLFFAEDATIREGFDLTLHPFCRNATASMDWGGVIMNKWMSTDNKSRHTRKTTDIFEMASGITMQTSVQCVAMQPNNLQELEKFEMDFLRQLPTTWDETRFIDGYPGKYVVMARRHGSDWYIAGLNAQSTPLNLTIDLFGFGDKLSKIYTDNKKGNPQVGSLKKDKNGKVKVTIQPNGGLIIQ